MWSIALNARLKLMIHAAKPGKSVYRLRIPTLMDSTGELEIIDILPYLQHKENCDLQENKELADILGYTMAEFADRYSVSPCSCGLNNLLFRVAGSHD
jgi:hypothetical protein